MIKTPFKYEFGFFTYISHILPDSDTIPPLMEKFKDITLLPSTINEVMLNSQKVQKRIKLLSSSNEWEIDFFTSKISIIKNIIDPDGTNLGSVEQFVKDATEYIGRIIELFELQGHRLALITYGLMDDISENQMSNIFQHTFKPLPFNKEHKPTEWNTRVCSPAIIELNGVEERLNVITNVNRIQGSMTTKGSLENFDRIELSFDINTYQRNKKPRFGSDETREFGQKALELRIALIDELKEHLNV